MKTRKIQNTVRLKALEQEKEKLLHDCQVLNVDPHKIDDTIKQQEEKVEHELKEIQQVLEQLRDSRY